MKKILFFFFLLWLSLPYPLHSQEEKPSELFAKAYPLFSEAKLSQAEDLFLKTLNRGFQLEDYSLYFLGMIASSGDNFADARRYFTELKKRFSQSVWSPDTELQLAKISIKEGMHQPAIEELRSLRGRRGAKKEISEEALYLLGQVHEVLGDLDSTYSLYQGLRHTSPLSLWAAKARKEVKRLRNEHAQLFKLKTPEALSEEGKLLLRERRYREAERVYRKLLGLIPQGRQRPPYLMELSKVYHAARKRRKAIPLLTEIVQKYPESPEAADALFRLARIYWNRDDNLKALQLFKQLKKLYPKNSFNDYAYLASARIYESLDKPQEALSYFREFSKEFPNSHLREEASWRLAWIYYLEADYKRANDALKHLTSMTRAKRYKTAALYWQARTAEKIGRIEEAKEILLRIITKEENSYYAGLAARMLKRIGGRIEEKEPTQSTLPTEVSPTIRKNIDFHFSRAEELAQISLNDLAVVELDKIKNLGIRDIPLKMILLREYARNQAYYRVVPLASQLNPSSDAINRYRYPLAFWEPIQKMSKEKGLDPYLVLSMIRQESLFNPKALSPASAYGLMQLIPSTAARSAIELGLQPPRPQKLFEPHFNLKLGTQHLKVLLDRYSNNWVKAIAAYNAGENAVARWERNISSEDEEEFIERIPYRETRLYVKLVLRNHVIYKRLYDSHK
ncbi:MAG: transglycosylase SLT domain-containing protein [Candidatus Binatia bacterium]